MSKISAEKISIERLSELAKLSLGKEESEKLCSDITKIAEYADTLLDIYESLFIFLSSPLDTSELRDDLPSRFEGKSDLVEAEKACEKNGASYVVTPRVI